MAQFSKMFMGNLGNPKNDRTQIGIPGEPSFYIGNLSQWWTEPNRIYRIPKLRFGIIRFGSVGSQNTEPNFLEVVGKI